MAVYGITIYGTDTYGIDYYKAKVYNVPPQYRVDPFTATSIDYKTIYLSWNPPQGTIYAWRLVKNMFGFPADQNDGSLLLDASSGYPGSLFTDLNVVAGRYHYYAFYVQVDPAQDKWVRAGVAACLATSNFGSSSWFLDLIPEFFQSSQSTAAREITLDPSGNPLLVKFINVFGWGADLIKSQYDTYRHVNDPWKIPQTDLYSLATQLGISVNPDIHPYTLRKAVYNAAAINQNRGTLTGISTEISALTGWSADIQTGVNLLLENDQSAFLDPSFPAWSANIAYNIGESVQYQNYWYQCIATGNLGNPPTGANSSNTWWSPVVGVNSSTYLSNSSTGNINTWEVLYPTVANGQATSGSIIETLGVANPLNAASFTYNSLQSINKTGSTDPIWMRSLSRTTADLSLNVPLSYPLNGNTDFSLGVTPWVTSNGAALSQSTTFLFPGNSQSLLVTPNGVTANPQARSELVPVLPVMPYTAQVNILCNVQWASGVQVNIDWYTSASTFISTTTGTSTQLTPQLWYTLNLTSISPATAAFGRITVQMTGTPSSATLFYLANAIFSQASFAPNKDQVVGDGIPVPFVSKNWSSSVRYGTNNIVTYSGQPFIALRASTGVTPPYATVGSSNLEWTPVSFDQRLRVCISAYATGSSAVPIYPFVEWFDSAGNPITRVYARTPSAGTIVRPDQLYYDSFTSGAGTSINARATDDGQGSWLLHEGSLKVSPYNNGCVYQANAGQRSYATVTTTGNGNCRVGVTFVDSPSTGQNQGLILRWQDDNNYIFAHMNGVDIKNAGVWTPLGSYLVPFQPGDRMIAQLVGAVITIFRNGVFSLSVASSFNITGLNHGIMVENQEIQVFSPGTLLGSVGTAI